jgi:hypothetical protein
VIERGARALARESLAPARACDQPRHLEAGPAVRLQEPDPPDQRAARLLLDRPQPVAADPPVAVDVAERAPGVVAVEWSALREMAHRLGVGGDARVGVEIAVAELPQPQAPGLELGALQR